MIAASFMTTRRHFLIALAGLGLFLPCAPAADLPETAIAYEIEVTLDPETRMLSGKETILWRNPSRTAIDTLPVHLYLNAFSNEDTTWMRSGGRSRVRIDDLLDRYPDPWGWIELRAVRQAGADLDWTPVAPDDGNPLDRTLVEVTLAEPLAPGETLTLTVEFDAKLPVPIARTGGNDDFFFVAQWFPKIGAFESVGVRGATEDRWAAHQFHGRTEFYADYAEFDVRIGVPPDWEVAATGDGGSEGGSDDDIRWHRYRQQTVHDFAFAAGEKMVSFTWSHQPEGRGGPVEVHLFTPVGIEHQIEGWRRAIDGSLDVLGARIGPYPYGTLTVVLPPWAAIRTAGMEYPTLFTGEAGDPFWDGSFLGGLRGSEATLTHEFAHQYFHGVIGSNELEEAFLDEGASEYWGAEAMIAIYGDERGGGRFLGRPVRITEFHRYLLPRADVSVPPIWSVPSYLARGNSSADSFYTRPAATFRTAAGLFGQETVDRVFAAYYERWAFAHPRFEDFLEVARAVGGDAVAEFILEAFTRTRLPDYRVAGLETEVWSPPRGRLPDGEEVAEPDGEGAGDDPLAGLDPAARETDGSVVVEILVPGWTRHDRQRAGRIERRRIIPEVGEPDADWEATEDEFSLSRVRLDGPGWDRLPVDLFFRFADGAVFRETWDGRAGYRDYRFLRPAPLSEVRIDPDLRIALDPDPANNARMRESEEAFTLDWSAWLGGLSQLLAEALTQWM